VSNASPATRLNSCLEHWQLSLVDRLAGGFRSDVFLCRAADGAQVVLKLPPTDEAEAEMAALTRWAPTQAAVRVIDLDHAWHALLLERLVPGQPLPKAGHDGNPTLVAAELLLRLHQAEPRPFAFPTVPDLYPKREAQARADAEHERRILQDPERAEAGLSRLPVASTAANALSESSRQRVLLHGDFCTKNILQDGDRYVVIDPIPMLGDPCSDVGHFAADQPAEVILETAAATASHIGLDEHRSLRWAAIWAVVQTSQAWREDQAKLECLVGSSEVDELLR
jgi:streptomycin 6-kinase